MSKNNNIEKKPTRKTVKLTDEIYEKLSLVSSTSGMNRGLIIDYLLDEAIRLNMFDEDWLEKIVKERFHVLLMEADVDYRKSFERDKHRAILDTKKMLLKELMRTLEKKEKRAYLESVLGDPTSGVDLLENLSSYQMVTVNGEKRFLPPGADGFPRIVGIPPSQIIRCNRGIHTVNSSCPGCDIYKTCEILREERIAWLAEHGTTAEQEAYIKETSGIRRLR